MQGILIKEGWILDPGRFNTSLDILIEDGVITKIARDILPEKDYNVFDAKNLLIVPGLIDLHTHIRRIEDIEKEGGKAIYGGFTRVSIMPNMKPPIDNPDVVREIKKAKKNVDILIIGAISEGMGQRRLADIGGMKKEGIFAISDDAFPIQDKHLLFDAMEIAKKLGLLVMTHCEPEEKMVERNIELALLTKSRLHILHISKRESVSLVKQAKKETQNITCEATPHYFVFTEDDVKDTRFKVNPPLRKNEDRDAVISGLMNGVIDIIATDHAPHPWEEKKKGWNDAPYGIEGLKICLSLAMTKLPQNDVILKLIHNPAKISGIECGIIEGKMADLTIIDPDCEWFFSDETSPYDGYRLKGKVVGVISKYCTYFEGPKGT